MLSTLLLAVVVAASQDPSGPLVVFNAGSLAAPMKELQDAFRRRHPGVEPRYESSGSVEAARKITDLGKTPDVLASADAAVMNHLVLPAHGSWYATFASNAMVIAFTEGSTGARDITANTWANVLRRPGIRIGRADPALDPAGYRALMLLQLAERHYRTPGLEKAILANSGERYTRPKSVELTALLQAGHLDYAIMYRTVAQAAGLLFLQLPPEIDLSDPEHEDLYAATSVDIPRKRRTQDGLLSFVGGTIAYAITIPTRAPNPLAARAFVRFVLGSDGRAILARHGFTIPAVAQLHGDTTAARVAIGAHEPGVGSPAGGETRPRIG